ncbi:glycosyltransferase [Aeromicrobium fastidiosum]|uniref:Glycosyltransferase n=1 Tax=Aeromicrobium fastidiosum TaxID=52699 RepID=A0A641ALQ3_9ACTN|nr:glycosyltransferase [Aeromicrobium fastidiosum]KAA1374814.1 glycosyltransferase [Aeromicrobium fastidiosum]MBP2390630.1 hyaluronan synthase [Aeromicrobium fastidiosum]
MTPSWSVDASALPSSLTWLVPFGLFGAISWGVWLLRKVLSATSRPTVNEFETSVSVVVPSFHEDPDVLMRCLATWRHQAPDRILIVLDVADTEAQRRIEALGDPTVEAVMFQHRGKRSALGVGMRMVDTELVVLVDSDTAWDEGLLAAVQMPFADPAIGAVSTRQNVYRPSTSIWRRVADWIIDLRYCDYAPAMGRFGGVICASGRTAAYRSSVVLPRIADLEHEIFLGRECIAGDDGRLTWLVLSQGYRVGHQDSARALSMFPDTFRAFVKQRIRWSRNSYRCYLTAIRNGWIFRVPFISQLTVMQILFTPVTMAVAMTYVVLSLRSEHPGATLGLACSWLMIGRGIRSLSHLRRRPQDIWLLPLVSVVVAFIALPIKVYALVTMNKQGWLTRTDDSIGGEGQSEKSVTVPDTTPEVAR